jgi:hypothetical protein
MYYIQCGVLKKLNSVWIREWVGEGMKFLFVKYRAIIKFIRMLPKLFILYNAVSVCVVL